MIHVGVIIGLRLLMSSTRVGLLYVRSVGLIISLPFYPGFGLILYTG